MKRILFGSVLAIGINSFAFAGGTTISPVDDMPSWTGFYAGADAGYAWG